MSNPELGMVVTRESPRGSLGDLPEQVTLQVPLRVGADVVKETGVRIKMPTTQAGRLTKAYNQLLNMRQAGSAEAVVMRQIELVQKEMATLRKQCESVHTANEEQEEFKAVWMRKYLYGKERFLAQLQEERPEEDPHGHEKGAGGLEPQQLQSREGSFYGSVRSMSSSVRRALVQAEEDQARLELKLKQLTQQQEQKREQQERRRLERIRREQEDELLQEQQERQELEQQLAGVRVRRAALSRAGSEGGRSQIGPDELPNALGSVESWLHNQGHGGPMEGPGQSMALPPPQAPSPGGFVHVTSPSRGNMSVQDQLLQHVILAQAKLPVFKGEPLEFLWFRRAFEAQVSSVTQDAARRLYILMQQLQGQPYELVKGCQLMAPEEGYRRAMSKLQEKYGHPVRQAMAFRNRLVSWPNVRSNPELEAFNVQLQLCQDVKLAGNGLAELDSPATLLLLASKLPAKLQLGWQTRAFDVEEKEQREATFNDFVRFVARQTGLRCHPVYSKLNTDKDGRKAVKVNATTTEDETVAVVATGGNGYKGNKKSKDESSSGLPTKEKSQEANAFEAPCLMCAGRHAASECRNDKLTKKERYEKLRGLCFACLHPGHLARSCTQRATCQKCGKRHPTILHVEGAAEQSEAAKKGAPEVKSDNETKAKAPSTATQEKALATREKSPYAVATVPVKVWYGSQRPLVVQAVLDPASTATFILASVVEQLGLKPQATAIGVSTINDHASMTVGVVSGLGIGDLDENHYFTVQTAYTVAELPFSTAPTADEVTRWKHLQDVPFHWRPTAPVAMLVGLNVAGALRPEEVVHGGQMEPYAVRTPLGWTVHGSLDGAPTMTSPHAKVLWTRMDDVAKRLENLHYQDFQGAFQFGEKGPSRDDEAWQKSVEASVKRLPGDKGYQYTIDLPFKAGAEKRLEDNYEQALQRLASIKRKFVKNPQFQVDYCDFISKMQTNDYVEEVQSTGRHPVSYVPHHGVYHPKKPGKIRVVFNCASKYKGVALNDCLLQGPDLTNSLVGVLLRFRLYAVAFMADIESMFYRVKVPERQRDLLRFLWWKKGEDGSLLTEETPVIYRLKVHLFGATSSPSVANYALRRSAEEAEKAGHVANEVKRAVEDNFYVDDCLKSMSTVKEAIDMAHGLVRACSHGGFRLTKFISTSKELLRSFPATELAKGLEEVDLNEDKVDPLTSIQERALGVMWNLAQDCFKFKVRERRESNDDPVSKRAVLSSLSAVYDPLGIAAPVIIVARILFREVTKANIGWDDELGAKWSQQWQRWEEQLQGLRAVSVPRCLIRAPGKRQLHLFCDASREAYAAVAYLRQERESAVTVSFVLGKARVSPPKVVTIPRLELTAAKLAVDLADVISRELNLDMERFFWSDSTTVLKYLRNKARRFHVFVANRICAILSSSEAKEWRYVPTATNPADEATRGLSADKLGGSKWLEGPSFLLQEVDAWPKEPNGPDLEEGDPEVKQEESVARVELQTDGTPIQDLATWFSSAHKVRRATAVWLRVKAWLKGAVTKDKMRQPFGLRELQAAEDVIVAELQCLEWPTEVVDIKEGRSVKVKSVLHKLNPGFVEQRGLIVMRSRIGKELVIVPSGAFGALIVQEAHVQQCHQGRASTAAAVMRRHWVVGLNKLVRKVVRSCPGCQRRHTRPQPTIMAPLPCSRHKPQGSDPFQTTGVDYFGPFHVSRGRSRVKAYGVIFTCSITRAVHLEVAEDLSSSSFINALRRFIARRGHVKQFLSDNGTNFVGSQTLLKKELQAELRKLKENDQVANNLRARGVEWTFNAPGASHHGGFWERLIRSIRRILEALLDRRTMTYESLVTMLCEAEAVMNNRPITTVSDDPTDLEPLTPNHLLIGRSEDNVAPPGDYSAAAALRQQWKRVQHVANEFWSRWHHEYKVLLHQQAKWHQAARKLQVNDPVLVLDPLLPRDRWRLGRVIEVHRSKKDGHVRAADVKTKQGVLTRPITKLCLLEAASENGVEGVRS